MKRRRIGVSYNRFSEPKQGKGDSEDRQDRDYRAFCQHHNLTPAGEVYTDRGRSGYKDEHRKKGRLGVLIAAAKDSAFEKDTVIVIEAWDRLGRLRPDKQTELVAELLRTGVSIGVCRLNDIFAEEDFGTHKWAILSTFIMLAYQESKQKAERVAAAWVKRRQRARETGKAMSARLPAWLRLVDGKQEPIPERVAAIARIFDLSALEYGRSRIIKTLIAEKVPPFGKSGKWSSPYIARILNDRRVLGELQPRKDDGTPDGDVIPNYFPRIVSDDKFAAARLAQTERREGAGRTGKRDRKWVNTFQGLLIDATDGGTFFLGYHGTASDPQFYLINAEGNGGRGPTRCIPYATFEEGILGKLAEVSAADVLPKRSEQADKARALRAKLAKVRGDLAGLKEDLARGYDRHLADLLRACGEEEERIAAELMEEMARNARPAEKVWGELPSLVALIREKGDEARLRIRTVLHNLVEEIRVLLVRRNAGKIRKSRQDNKRKGSELLIAAQVFFKGGTVRSYLFRHQSAGFHRPERWSVRSFADTGAGPIDLRDREQAQRLAAALETAPPGD
jgi:DNA invertase Pin-like site-specific DNA recombinase